MGASGRGGAGGEVAFSRVLPQNKAVTQASFSAADLSPRAHTDCTTALQRSEANHSNEQNRQFFPLMSGKTEYN
jgi:hypothetical protein